MTNEQNTFTDYAEESDSENEQTITVAHVSEPHDTYGGRGNYGRCFGDATIGSRGWMGNPYTVEEYGRHECISRFEDDFETELREDRMMCNAVLSLRGQVVACHCRHSDEDKPACHLDVVKEWLASGKVLLIADSIHDIPLTPAEHDHKADPEVFL